MEAKCHVFISGKVHGVFFRANTRDIALNLGLKGFVRNLPDGRVEAVFEGDKEKIKKIIEFCKKGPPGAIVENLDVKWEKYNGDFKDFQIKYD
jgi:acylphosphatase